MTPKSTPGEAQYKRPDASMSLLINIMDHSLDEGYAEATARRAVRGEEGVISRAPGARLLVAVGVGLIAVVVTMAAMQVRAAAPQAEKERRDLINRIHTRETDADVLQKEVEALRDRLDALQDKNLSPDELKRVQQLAMSTGAEAVEGPGVKVVVDDAEQADAKDGANKDPRQQAESLANGRVLDRDLQRVVNGLWAAGAEAIGINGQRLTALSAIRAAGASILVDNRPLSPPYTVLAIGDAKKMQVDFQDGPDGRYLHALGERYGIRATIGTQKKIKLPAAIGITLRVAQPEGSTPQGGSTPSPGPGPSPGAGPGTVSPSAGGTPSPGATRTASAPTRTPSPAKTGKTTPGAGTGSPSNKAAARDPAPAHEEGQA
ncbi:DUF881 domain-containing protein [Yinghuangia soli]|uniref:DUF881 domain-containing protein n=1 Tax=Yinghuangia soli TaxID=2908204 RepID=A0AA41PY52_9ACTN|nr:DUF881 domain-containing protein [Yinghuangia soli]MCF2527540.1 DUF881 domain-containing protein [Yinghuangia soli]